MKKSLIALAVLGALSGAASAQSSVTMYGIVDVGLQWNEFGANPARPRRHTMSQESVWGIDSGLPVGQPLGRARLGSAGPQLERGVRRWRWASTSTPARRLRAGALFGRQAYVGLRHTASVRSCSAASPTPSSGTGDFDLFGTVDPFGTGFGPLGLQATFIPSRRCAEDNSVLWASPTWAGFKFAAQYSANVDRGETAPQAPTPRRATLAPTGRGVRCSSPRPMT